MSAAKSVMVLGCTSDAGKSFLATALCRWYARQGLNVAPFKAQNMSNHARVVAVPEAPPGTMGEIGSAQYFQALAARATPEPAMNPVLLKPEADNRSQVVVMGRVDPELTSLPWRQRSARLWPEAHQALEDLRRRYDVLVIEGAGSPAEINLTPDDYVNTRTAIAAGAACLLVADIDRGGAFAHLYGTHTLMHERVRGLVRGFVLNKFRGDQSLLAPAPYKLQQMTGVPTLGILPLVRNHGLPEEDAVPATEDPPTIKRQNVVVVTLPHASNLDEFEGLRSAGVSLTFTHEATVIANADWLILPGSKNTRADLAWLRETWLDRAIIAHCDRGRPLVAICGGLQMLGRWLHDPDGLEGGEPGSAAGLGILPVDTTFGTTKILADGQYRLGHLHGVWKPLSKQTVRGYEIHLGSTQPLDRSLHAVVPDTVGLGWQRGNVLGVYLHGLFENPEIVKALFGNPPRSLDTVFDDLADMIDHHFEPGSLLKLLEPA